MIEMVKIIEQWKLISTENVKPYYYVSTFGRVYSTFTNTFLKQQVTENGYLVVGLMTADSGRIYRKVHRLVLETFMPIPEYEIMQVNHKDCNKFNNNIWNLEWNTPKENIAHAIENNLVNSVGECNPMAKLSENDVIKIYNMLINGFDDNSIVNTIPNCNKHMIRLIANGKTWSYLFNNDQINAMKATRNGNYISDNYKHLICKYYQNNIHRYENFYNKAKLITHDALNYLGIEINDRSIRIARRLLYRLQNPEITNNYIY